MKTNKLVSVLSLILGLLMTTGLVACGGDSDDEGSSYIPKDGEKFYEENYFADFTFINGGRELELTESHSNFNYIPQSVEYKGKTYPVTQIGKEGCAHKTISEIPEGIVRIGEDALLFNDARFLELPTSLKYIGAGALSHNKNIEEISIPSGITTIEKSTFEYCTSLSNVSIPNSVNTIGEKAFLKTALKTLNVPGSVTSIGERAFAECDNLAEISLPSSLVNIGDGAFSGCVNLAEISLPSSLVNIGDGAFFRCKSLVSITIPENVKSIGANTFCDAYKIQSDGIVISSEDCLKEVISKIKEPFPIAKDVFGYNFLNYGILYVPKGTAEKYKTTEGWKEIQNIVEL